MRACLLTATLAVLLPVLLFFGVCASYFRYLLSGSETRKASLETSLADLKNAQHRLDT